MSKITHLLDEASKEIWVDDHCIYSNSTSN